MKIKIYVRKFNNMKNSKKFENQKKELFNNLANFMLRQNIEILVIKMNLTKVLYFI